jgi:hypothetical protein
MINIYVTHTARSSHGPLYIYIYILFIPIYWIYHIWIVKPNILTYIETCLTRYNISRDRKVEIFLNIGWDAKTVWE